MPRPPFPGYPRFLEEAAAQLGCPENAAPAGRITALSLMANLCAQASVSGPGPAVAILEKAAEFRDQIRAASLAADLMLSEVRSGLGLDGGSTGAPKAAADRRLQSSSRNADD